MKTIGIADTTFARFDMAASAIDELKNTGTGFRIERYTVLRSPHIDKKSREQFEIRTHKRIIDIANPTAKTIEALNKLVVPAGVFVKIKA